MENQQLPNHTQSPTLKFNNQPLLSNKKASYRLASNNPKNIEQTISFRKRKPTPLKQTQQQQNQTLLLIRGPKNYENLHQRKVWRKKGKVITEAITKISQISAEKQIVNIQGQIIFIWTKPELLQTIKLPDNTYKSGQLYDGSGSIIFFMPTIFLYQKNILQNGQNIRLLKAKVKRMGKQKPYILCTEDTIIESSQTKLTFELEKFAITVKQLLEQPVGITRNVMGLVIHDRQNLQTIKKGNREELNLSKIIVYDPEDDCEVQVKLWGQKTGLKFYNSVYILRGIQIKQYKQKREYTATKDFTYRALAYSKIQNYLRPLYQQRQILLREKPVKAALRNISKACALMREDPDLKIVWSIVQCNILSFAYDSYENYKYSLCSIFENKVMISADKSAKCFFCLKTHDSQNHQSHYAIKIEFQDAFSQFYAQCHDDAVLKLFSQTDTQTIQLYEFQQMNLQLKQNLSQRLSGDLIHGLFATVREKYGEHEIFTHYLIDLVALPEDDTF